MNSREMAVIAKLLSAIRDLNVSTDRDIAIHEAALEAMAILDVDDEFLQACDRARHEARLAWIEAGGN